MLTAYMRRLILGYLANVAARVRHRCARIHPGRLLCHSPQHTDHAADPLGDAGLCAAPSENRPIRLPTGVSAQQLAFVRPDRPSTAPT